MKKNAMIYFLLFLFFRSQSQFFPRFPVFSFLFLLGHICKFLDRLVDFLGLLQVAQLLAVMSLLRLRFTDSLQGLHQRPFFAVLRFCHDSSPGHVRALLFASLLLGLGGERQRLLQLAWDAECLELPVRAHDRLVEGVLIERLCDLFFISYLADGAAGKKTEEEKDR